MKTIFFSLIVLLFTSFGSAQDDIDLIEYFFDNDPGLGLATPLDINPDAEIINSSFSISTSGLTEGTHRLFIRTIKQDGTIGLYEHKTFRIYPTPDNNTADIVEMEYFFNTDPGVGNGFVLDVTDAANIDEVITLNTSSLPVGTHRAFVRVKNADDTYSIYEHKTFRVYPTPDNNAADIVEVEYFFNTDPGVGNGFVLDVTDAADIDEVITLNTSALPVGTHRAFLRVKNANNIYSIYEHRTFRVFPTPDTNTANITAAEFFIDADPGIGNGTALTVSGDDIDTNLVVPTTGALADGFHYLYIRVLNADGNWSLWAVDEFEVSGTLGVEDIALKTLKIYPNPVEDNLFISTPNTIKINNLKVYNLEGKLVLKTNTFKEKLNVSNLNAGTYLVIIETDKVTINKKMIKN
ncbi:T9SS type A sorting domain-containing protein [Aurantibacter aestuarii]|uniref:Secretion system C-terminal sorting domain-containing protein n=1 Tax=Aurantibacter aestuarii TaxID=1266046 RepID=A0A2T1NA13_9FLAO|nr:T9SS type A sorting domain-containing protein [Aurantibacter aestuarii]PSG88717.1 hypothetical protein C7H52_10535 [Aurantibacter aestuarii]